MDSQNNPYADLTPQRALALLAENSGYELLDVRTSDEFAETRIAGSQHLDVYDPEFFERVSALPREQRYIVYCHTGARSGFATDLMQRLGFAEAHNVAGGIKEWERLGLPLQRA